MKKLILLLFITLFGVNAFAQRVATDYGDIYFEFFHFKEAAEYYEQALVLQTRPPKRQYLYQQLAQCYKYQFKYAKAEEYFEKAMTSGEEIAAEWYIDYGNILKLNGKYKEAKVQYKKYQEVTKTELAESFIRSVNWAIRHADTIRNYEIFATNLNISGQSLGYAFYDDGLIYSHARNKPRAEKEMPLFDLDYARAVKPTEFIDDMKMMAMIEFNMNEGAPSVSPDKTILYFNANATAPAIGKTKKVGDIEVSDEGVSNFKVYEAKLEGGLFTNPIALPFNDDEYSCIHPCISEDGNTIYFSSNMDGGFGGFDLYKSTRMADGTWSEPINLGKNVNTEENELFPYINTGMLYFSSKGFNGYGGYDIFIAKLNKSGMPFSLKNIGQPINSYRDDMAFITQNDGATGYFTTNRDNDEGNDAVYYFTETDGPVYQVITTKVDSGSIPVAMTGVLGNLQPIDPMERLAAQPPIVLPKVPTTSTATSPPGTPVAVAGKAGSGSAPTKPSSPTKAAVGVVAAASASSSVPSASGNKPASVKEPTPQPTKQQNQNLDSKSPIQVSADEAAATGANFNPILFKFNDAGVNPNSMESADSVVAYLKANRSLKVFLTGHADSRGPFEYNMKLSERRAATVRNYLIKKGIPANRIIVRGLSESQLLNECADGVTCTDEQHSINRRVELKLVR